jgi:hypothetical protein
MATLESPTTLCTAMTSLGMTSPTSTRKESSITMVSHQSFAFPFPVIAADSGQPIGGPIIAGAISRSSSLPGVSQAFVQSQNANYFWHKAGQASDFTSALVPNPGYATLAISRPQPSVAQSLNDQVTFLPRVVSRDLFQRRITGQTTSPAMVKEHKLYMYWVYSFGFMSICLFNTVFSHSRLDLQHFVTVLVFYARHSQLDPQLAHIAPP